MRREYVVVGLMYLFLLLSGSALLATTTNTPANAVIINLDAPTTGGDWALLVSVGQTKFAVPRSALKQFVLQHPQWVYKEEK